MEGDEESTGRDLELLNPHLVFSSQETEPVRLPSRSQPFSFIRVADIDFISTLAGGVEKVAEILNLSTRRLEKQVIENLERNNPALVKAIKPKMFVFEDIIWTLKRQVGSG